MVGGAGHGLDMKAYFDESGDDPRDKIYVLAGWTADESVWNEFRDAWTRVLTNAGIQHFKHNEARALKKQFEGRSETERDEVLRQLVQVVCAHDLIGLICSFKHPLFQLLLSESRIPASRLKKIAYGGYSSPYYFCFHLAVSQLLRYLVEERHISENVNFVFDDRTDALRPCIKLYDRIQKAMPSEIKAVAGTATAGDDRTEPALQAADLLAGQVLANVRVGAPEPALQKLATCRTILKCRIEPEDLSRFKATLLWANERWKELELDTT
jgi:hypothetical protein